MQAYLRAFLPGEKLVLIIIALGVFRVVPTVVAPAVRMLRTMRGTAQKPGSIAHRAADSVR
jgi:hypothetical protein